MRNDSDEAKRKMSHLLAVIAAKVIECQCSDLLLVWERHVVDFIRLLEHLLTGFECLLRSGHLPNPHRCHRCLIQPQQLHYVVALAVTTATVLLPWILDRKVGWLILTLIRVVVIVSLLL